MKSVTRARCGLVAVAAAWIVGSVALAACGGGGSDDSTGSGEAGPDATADGTSSHKEAGGDANDASTDETNPPFDAPSDVTDAALACSPPVDAWAGAMPDAAPLAQVVDAGIQGTALAPDAITFVGLTSDDYAVYSKAFGRPTEWPYYYAAPLDGGPTQEPFAATMDAGFQPYAYPRGTAVIATDDAEHDGTVFAWKTDGTSFRASPPTQFAPTVDLTQVTAMSADGTRAAFEEQESSVDHVIGVDFAASSVTQIDDLSGTSSCINDGLEGASFAGNALIYRECSDIDRKIVAFNGAAWTRTVLATGDASVATNPSSNAFLVRRNDGALMFYATGSSVPSQVAANVTSVAITPDGSRFVYATSAGGRPAQLFAATIAAPTSPTPLACGLSLLPFGATGAVFSPDGQWTVGTTGQDLWIASTTSTIARPIAPFQPQLQPVYASSILFFSADSTHLFFADSHSLTQGLWSAPVSGGDAVLVARGAWPAEPLDGSRVAFIMNGTLYDWDASGANAPVAVTTLPTTYYATISASRRKAIYQTVTPAGINVVDLP